MEQILEKAKLTCASCGADMYIGLKEFVDASENPEMKAAILDGSFFLETCRYNLKTDCKNEAPSAVAGLRAV